MSRRTDSALVRSALDDLLGRDQTADLVAAYFDPAQGFAGAMFDGLEETRVLIHNPHDVFSADDIAAASLLDVRFGPSAVRQLLTSTEIHAALSAVPVEATLWEYDPTVIDAAAHLWTLVRRLEGVGRTRASKLLARKRPNLVPIVDSVIADALHLGDHSWEPLAHVLADDALRDRLMQLRPVVVDPRVSVLRILDVAVWMSHSRSERAVAVQQQVGAPVTRQIGVRTDGI